MARTATKPATAAQTQSSQSQSSDSTSTGNNRPVHTIRSRNLRASIWLNEGSNGSFHSVTLSRSYQDNENNWHDVTSFNQNDLPLLAKLANDCHTWIAWQVKRAADEAAREKAGKST